MKGNMKVGIRVATLCLSTILFLSNLVGPVRANYNDNVRIDAYPVITFSTYGATEKSYTAFMNTMREVLQGSFSHGIRVLKENSTVFNKTEEYSTVKLKNQLKNVTIGLNVINLYLVAFLEGNNSYFFSDAPSTAMTFLFNNTNKTPLKFGSRYADLEAKGAFRSNTYLGVNALSDAIDSLNRGISDEKQLAKSLLVVIQMVSEATRFTYIQQVVLKNFSADFIPGPDVTSRETNWGKLSTGIQTAYANETFKNAVQLQYPNGTTYNVTAISQIRAEMGILLYVKS